MKCRFYLISEYIEDLPIILVFSLATTLDAVHKSLPHSVSTRLSIEKFQAEPSLECLHEILNKVTQRKFLYFLCRTTILWLRDGNFARRVNSDWK